jgi:glutaredoxin 3
MFITPSITGYTIYSKSGCPYCDKAKSVLKIYNPVVVDCDPYLVDNKEDFLQFIKEITQKEHRTFPIIFKDSTYIGGYSDLLKFLVNQDF